MDWSRRLFHMAAVLFGILMEKISRVQENRRKNTEIRAGYMALGQALKVWSSGKTMNTGACAFAGSGKNNRQINNVKRNEKEYIEYQKHTEARKAFKKRGLYKARDCPIRTVCPDQ